jgi:hypothetical protein
LAIFFVGQSLQLFFEPKINGTLIGKIVPWKFLFSQKNFIIAAE